MATRETWTMSNADNAVAWPPWASLLYSLLSPQYNLGDGGWAEAPHRKTRWDDQGRNSVIFHKSSSELRTQHQTRAGGGWKKKVNNEYAWCAEVAAVHLLSVMNNLRHVLSPQFPWGGSKATLPSPQRNSAGQVACHIPSILVKKGKEKRGKCAWKLTWAQQECWTSLPSLQKLLH